MNEERRETGCKTREKEGKGVSGTSGAEFKLIYQKVYLCLVCAWKDGRPGPGRKERRPLVVTCATKTGRLFVRLYLLPNNNKGCLLLSSF